MEKEFDLFVIGAGSGGVRAARFAASLGAKVAIAEDLFFGGTCVNVGCVPKKLYVYASEFAEEFEAAKGFGWQSERPQHSWAKLLQNKDEEIARLNGIYINLLKTAGVEIFQGHASLLGKGQVLVNGARSETVKAKNILLAVGGWPRKPTFPGAELTLDSNDLFRLRETPKKVLIQGGGYIAVEFAGIFQGLGSETELLYRGEKFLRGFDFQVRDFVEEEIQKKGVSLTFNDDIVEVRKHAEGQLEVQLTNNEVRKVDAVLSAIGREPKVQNLGLENTRVQLTGSGHIQVNTHFETDEPGVFALGDVVGRKELTPVALAEGMALAKYLFANEKIDLNYDLIPTAVFCQPNIATVGLGEDELRLRDIAYESYVSIFRPLKNTLSASPEKTMMKILVDKKSDKVLGCHMVGPHAGEIIQGVAIALVAGATKKDFDKTIGIHPTSAEEFVTMRTPVSH